MPLFHTIIITCWSLIITGVKTVVNTGVLRANVVQKTALGGDVEYM